MREERRGKGKRETAATGTWSALVWSAVLTGATVIFCLGVCAVLVAAGIIPEQGMDACVLLSCVAGTLVGGRMALKGVRKGTLLWGLCGGALTAVMLGLSGFLLYDGVDWRRCAMVGCACLCGGGLAGALGRGGNKRRRI